MVGLYKPMAEFFRLISSIFSLLILEGKLICLKNHKFPIKDGIPRLVIDKSKTFVKTENSFSSKCNSKWNEDKHETGNENE